MYVALEMKTCVVSMNAFPPLLPPVYSSIYHFHCVFIKVMKKGNVAVSNFSNPIVLPLFKKPNNPQELILTY